MISIVVAKPSQLVGLLTPEVWAGAVLGALVSALFAASTGFFRQLRKLFPLRRLLGDLANNEFELLCLYPGHVRTNQHVLLTDTTGRCTNRADRGSAVGQRSRGVRR